MRTSKNEKRKFELKERAGCSTGRDGKKAVKVDLPQYLECSGRTGWRK